MDKQYILDEIKRTAKANGNKPLGIKKFEKETSIKFSDWYGKYWAKWSDAVHEAGFQPNKMNKAYEDDLLIDKYISLIRELGHIPAHGEICLKSRNDSAFPSHNTFARLGSKKQLLSKIIKYCQKHAGFDDVIDLCQKELNEKSKVCLEPISNGKELTEAIQDGFVYLLKSGKNYKIGKTNYVGRREYELKIQLPETADIIHKIKTDDPTGIEAYWHKRFEAKRKRGEWFDLDRADIKAFKHRNFM